MVYESLSLTAIWGFLFCAALVHVKLEIRAFLITNALVHVCSLLESLKGWWSRAVWA